MTHLKSNGYPSKDNDVSITNDGNCGLVTDFVGYQVSFNTKI